MSRSAGKDPGTLDLFAEFELERQTPSEALDVQVLPAPIKHKPPSRKAKSKEMAPLTASQERHLTDKDVAKRFGICRQTVWRWVKEGHFPSPEKLSSRTTRWKLSELVAYEASLSGGGTS